MGPGGDFVIKYSIPRFPSLLRPCSTLCFFFILMCAKGCFTLFLGKGFGIFLFFSLMNSFDGI